jgi:Zn-dependent protease
MSEIDIVYVLIVIVVILFSMTLHEAMHAYASYWLGDHTARLQGRLTLNPVKHIDPFLTLLLPVMLAILGAPVFGGAKPVPINPHALRWSEWGMAIVALAGPLTNLLIAFLAFGVWSLVGYPVSGLEAQIIVTTVSVNLGFFVFNMIPIPPLDGSRVLYALAPEFVQKGMEAIERYGIMIVFGLLLIAGDSFSLLIGTVINFIIEVFSNIFTL